MYERKLRDDESDKERERERKRENRGINNSKIEGCEREKAYKKVDML
jgi:hypothetical protein